MTDNRSKNRIAEHRDRRGWGVEDLAERLGVSRQTVWKLETGRMQLTPRYLADLATVFGLPQAAFLADSFGLADTTTGNYGDQEDPQRKVTPSESPLEDLSEFFADVQEALQQAYAEEKIPIGRRELARAAFQTFNEITAETTDPRERDKALGRDIKLRRRFLREHRTELLMASQPPRKTA